jgi:hypothetical protein
MQILKQMRVFGFRLQKMARQLVNRLKKKGNHIEERAITNSALGLRAWINLWKKCLKNRSKLIMIDFLTQSITLNDFNRSLKRYMRKGFDI